jgi:hypothetical protein
VIEADTASKAKAAMAQARRLEIVARDAKAEIDRIDSLYKAWRATTIVERTETRSYALAIKHLPEWTTTPPKPVTFTGTAKEAWESLGLAVTIEALSQRPEIPPARGRHPMVGDQGDEVDTNKRVVWRVPRPVRIWVWRRASSGDPVLERVSNAEIVDADAVERYMTVDERLFGEATGMLEFSDLGTPVKASIGNKSALGAFGEALSGAPAAIAAGLEAASKAQIAIASLEDAREKRQLDAIKQQKDKLQAELDLKGLEATAEDLARLKALEQQVSIAENEGKLAKSPPSELDVLKGELELAKTQDALRRVRAGETLDDDNDSIEDQLAGLAARVSALEGR